MKTRLRVRSLIFFIILVTSFTLLRRRLVTFCILCFGFGTVISHCDNLCSTNTSNWNRAQYLTCVSVRHWHMWLHSVTSFSQIINGISVFVSVPCLSLVFVSVTSFSQIIESWWIHVFFWIVQCINLVDYYLPLFFSEMTSVQPGDFCNKVNLCQNIANISLKVQENTCEFCEETVSSLLDKIKDPDTEVSYLILVLYSLN